MESASKADTAQSKHWFGLPQPPGSYLAAPALTWAKATDWLNARWQLRNATVVGRWTRVAGKLVIANHGGTIIIGERVLFHSEHGRSLFSVFQGGRLEIGDRTSINYAADFAATGLISIGADCRIGTNVIIMDNDFHEIDDRSRQPLPKPVMIEDSVWIANRSMVLPGVTIGRGSVIGAGSVVMTDIPEHSLAMGNPARVIKKLA
jgi:acetyltransferase-like isoleucine patch superfamily enzyme